MRDLIVLIPDHCLSYFESFYEKPSLLCCQNTRLFSSLRLNFIFTDAVVNTCFTCISKDGYDRNMHQLDYDPRDALYLRRVFSFCGRCNA